MKSCEWLACCARMCDRAFLPSVVTLAKYSVVQPSLPRVKVEADGEVEDPVGADVAEPRTTPLKERQG
eukprot:8810422-Pyramimonas_sp.AAC.1